jgi:uncharacterized protein
MSVMNMQKPWYRESWPWLLMLPPAASVIAGVALLYLALREPAPLVVDDYARIEEISREQATADRNAADLNLAATVSVTMDGRDRTRIAVQLAGDVGTPPRALVLRLRHAGHMAADRTVTLEFDGSEYTGRTDLANGRYDFDLAPANRPWRLAGAFGHAPTTVRVVAE